MFTLDRAASFFAKVKAPALVIDRPTRTAKWLTGSTFLRAAQTSKAHHAIAGIWICMTTSSVLVNWMVLALGLSHPRNSELAQRPRNPFPFGQIALFADSLNESSRIPPAEDEFACSFTNEVDGNLVADHACRDRRHVSARGEGCRKRLFFLFRELNAGQSYRPSILATTKMSIAPTRPPPKSRYNKE